MLKIKWTSSITKVVTILSFVCFFSGSVLAHGPSRQKVSEKIIINASPEKVWEIVSNFSDFTWNNEVISSKSIDNKVAINILDEGEGFKEKDTNKIFKRFYSNRPNKFGQHSGLGLNIVKNLVDLHNATIKASNRANKKGASMEIIFPKI